MSPGEHGRLAALFDELAALPESRRHAALEALEEPLRTRLARLLAADAQTRDPVQSAVAAGAQALNETALQGQRIGPYRVLRELGAGGMGAVLLAERADGQFAQQVAIKLIRGFPTEDGVRRLRQERQILAQLDHPHIARLLDGGETLDGQPYVVMEYVPGLPLLAYIARTAPDLRARLALFDRIAAAVQHAHERLVIHRDLKPGNVLVREDGEPRLLDFGIAKLVDVSAASDPRETSTRVWTPGYASPEQQAGGLVTTASDVFGLAVLLREMLSGERAPGVAGSVPPEFRPVTLDPDLRGILAQAGAIEPAERYPTVEALRADLRRWREGRPVHAAADTVLYRMRKFVGRHRVAAAAVAMALLGAAGFVWRLALERERALTAEAASARALVAAERQAANARAAFGFLSDAFSAAIPENAMSTEVNVRQLLDSARSALERRADAEPQVRRPIQRMLGHLYHSLGEPAIAAALFEDGLQDAVPEQRGEALELADDFDTYSSVLGSLERGEEALDVAHRGARLRQEFAPDDVLQRLRSEDQIAFAYYRLGRWDDADRQWSRVIAEAIALDDPPVDLISDAYQALGNMVQFRGDAARALEIADAGWRFIDSRVAPESPLRINLLRLKAEALARHGRPDLAEPIIREAIALQERTVGDRGLRIATLYNGLGTILNDLGRYREAVEAMNRSSGLSAAAQVAAGDEAMGLSNLAAVLENAGDYERAIPLFEQALSRVEQGSSDPDDLARRVMERSYARCLGLAGQLEAAQERMLGLQRRALALDGEQSFEYAMTTWQLTLLARRRADPEAGLQWLAQARRLFAALAPESHAVFGHMLRAEADFIRMRGDVVGAEALQRRALTHLEAAAVLPVDVAIARSELAALLRARGSRAAAIDALRQALPVLRDAMLPQEVHRAAAERAARELGISG